MFQRLFFMFVVISAVAGVCFGQNSNTSTTRPRTQSQPAPSVPTQGSANTQTTNTNATGSRTRRGASGASDPTSKGVLDAFNALLDAIRAADVEEVVDIYWNSPQLVLFNNNGTTTRGWEQMRQNRRSSYPNLKDVKLQERDVRVLMIGREGAVVTCLWTQSQTYRGTPETASGRMTLVFRRVGKVWKAIHLHTSPDAPDPSRVMPSEQTENPSPAKPRSQ